MVQSKDGFVMLSMTVTELHSNVVDPAPATKTELAAQVQKMVTSEQSLCCTVLNNRRPMVL